MQAEMQQFRNQKVWVLVTLPDGKRAIGTKWILKNKRDARRIVCRNKARLVIQGHRQEERIDYTDVFVPVSRIEAIRLFLAFASFIGFKVYQMDVKSAFLYGKIAEEVYVTQPRGFEDPDHPKKVYKVVKALYGLHQAPRAWYERLSTFLLTHGYKRGTIDKNWCEEFESLMQSEFEMSSIGPLTFFLGLQVDQRPDGIFIHKEKEKNVLDEPISVHLYRSMIGCLMYLTATRSDIMFAVYAAARHQVTPKTSNLLSVKRIFKYLTAYPKLGLWYLRDSLFDLKAFSDSDYAGAHGDRKPTTGGCQFLRRRLISWQCKKQTIVATSYCEAEYVAAASCCGQRTKHIEIRHHFIWDANEKKLIQVLKIPTERNVADLLTKSFDVTRFGYLVVNIVSTCLVCWTNPLQGHIVHLWFLFTFAGRVTFCWLFPIPADGVKGLVATNDGTAYTVTEASIRSALQLDDFNAIDTIPNAKIFAGLQDIGYTTEGKFTFFKNKFSPQWKFLIHTLIHCLSPKSGSWNQFASNIAIALICLSTGRKNKFSNIIFNVTKKFFANMRHYQGPDMPLLAHMLNQGEPAFIQAQQQEVSPPPPSPVVAPHPLPDPMPSPPRQSSPPSIPFGLAPSSRVVSSKPIPYIPSSFGPSELVLETITSHIRGDDTGGGSFHESLPRPPHATPTSSPTVGVTEEPLTLTSLLALFPTCLQRIATLEAKLKATKILHRDTVVLFARRIKKLESKLKTKKRKLVLSDSENKEEARQSQELEVLLDLTNAAFHEPNFTDAAIPASELDSTDRVDFAGELDSAGRVDSAVGRDFAGRVVSAGGVDSADGLISASVFVAAGPTVPTEPSSPIRDPSKGKATELLEKELKQSLDAEQVYLDSLLAQRVAEEQERESMASAVQSTQRQAELDRVALNLTNEEWIGLVDQVQTNLTLSAELLGADVSEDTFSVRMVDLMNKQRKAISEMKAKEKREKPMTPSQQKEFMRTFIVYDKIRRAVDVAIAKDHHQHLKRSGETLESSESKKLKSSHSTEQPTELSETTFVSAGATIDAGNPIPAVTSVSAASSVLAETPIATVVSTTAGASGSASGVSVLIIELLDSPPKDTSLSLDPETEEQDVPLRKSSRKKSIAKRRTLPSPSKSKSAALLFDEDDPEAEFKKYLRQVSDDDEPAEHVSLSLELMYWAGRADLMVLYGMVSDKYKIERATGIGLGLWSDLRTLITAREDRDASIIWDDQDGGLLGIVIPAARVFCFCWHVFIPAGDLFQLAAPPSPDYVPGPEHPPSHVNVPEFVLEPVYPEFRPAEDDILPDEEESLLAAASPTTESPGYIDESDPDEYDPEEDPIDYPADGGNEGDHEDESSDDEEDDDIDIDGDERRMST
nr:retrovirus-related Pol polyprotein from transposon TNT 1-94 [Tanacetum cinerariifolium]